MVCFNSNSMDQIKTIEEIHQEACEREEAFYIDPLTGYQVFTEYHHIERGYCCNSGCRHCPYKNKSDTSNL